MNDVAYFDENDSYLYVIDRINSLLSEFDLRIELNNTVGGKKMATVVTLEELLDR